MTQMDIFRAANRTWDSSVENLYPYTILHLLTYEKPHIKTISILGHSDHHTGIVIELALLFAYTYILIPEITILGCSDHQTDIRLVWSPNGYCDWIQTEIWCNFHIHMY